MQLRPQSTPPQQSAYHSAIGAKLFEIQERKGFVKVMFLGDSTMFGTSTYASGIRLPLMVGLAQAGLEVQAVGDVTPDDGEARFLVNDYGNQKLCQAIGNITTRELVTGVTSGATGDIGATFARTVTPLAAALVTNTPDAVFISCGINDLSTGSQAEYEAVLAAIKAYGQAYQRDVPVVWFYPPAGNTVTNSFLTVSSSFQTKASKLRAAILAQALPYSLFVNSNRAFGIFARYPARLASTDSDRANGFFIDGVHPAEEGEAMRAALGLSMIFGIQPTDMMRMICDAAPYERVPWEYSGTVSGATVEMNKVLQRKNVITFFQAHNTGAGTATVTLNRKRYAQNGSTVAATNAAFVWTIPTGGAPVGFALPSYGNMAKDGGLQAWYNESWTVACATSACEIRATGYNVTN